MRGKEYFKWTLVVPLEEIEALGWKGGEEQKLKPMNEAEIEILVESI